MSTSARDAGIQAMKAGDPKTALQHFGEAIAQNPRDAQAHAYMGAAYGQLNMPDQAVACLRAAEQLAPPSAMLQFNLGVALERAAKPGEAAAAYQKALSLEPANDRARQALARLGYAAPAAQAGAATIADAPSHYAAAPSGLQPLGDWTPPAAPPSTGGGLADYQTAPHAPAPPPGAARAGVSDVPDVHTLSAPERAMPRSEQLGHSMLAGMGQGVWWGLIFAGFLFLWSLMHIKADVYGKFFPVVLALMGMYVAFGALLYGVVGLIGGMSDDAESSCHTMGVIIGILSALAWTMFNWVSMYTGVPQFIGCIFISRMIGKGLGGKIDEWRSTITLVTGPRGIGMVPSRH